MRGSTGVVTLLLAGLLAPSATATFPGANGRIVFASNRRPDLQPQLFAVAAGGGSPRNVSQRPAYINDAPDARGGLLAYASGPANGYGDTGIVVLTRSRTRRLVDGSSPLLAPDGARVLFADHRGLSVLDLRTRSERRLTNWVSPAAWSPDGRWVATIDANGVELVRADGGERRLLRALSPTLTRFAWSPDGTKLVLEDDGEIAVLDVATGAEARLGPGAQPAWSPDGERIAFVRAGAIATMGADGSDARDVTSPAEGVSDSSPLWSPDGQRLAFLRTRQLPSGAESWIGIDDGSYVTAIGGHYVDSFTWSSDGRTIYYSSRSLRDVFHLFTVGPNLRAVRQLTRGAGDDREPVWAPDGRMVAFVQNGASLVVLDRGRERVVAQQAGMSSPTWSPDGHRLAYAAGAAVWVIDVRRPGRRGLVGGSQPAWSPAGRWIAYVHGGLRLVRADGTGDHWLKADDDELVYRNPTWSPRGDVLYYDVFSRCSGDCYPEEGSLRAVRPFAQPVADVRVPDFAGKPSLSPDGRFFVFGGLRRAPISGAGTFLNPLSWATDVEPDWQRLKARPRPR